MRIHQFRRCLVLCGGCFVPLQDECLVSSAAKNANASARIEQLAMPRKHNEGQFRDPEWTVSLAACQAHASERTRTLSEARKLPAEWCSSRSPAWQVRRRALNAECTPRMEELSVPIKRETMDHLQFNPDAFQVAPNALKGRCTARLEELAQPAPK